MLLEQAGFRSVEVRPLAKCVTVGYGLAHYARSNSYSRLFTPISRAFDRVLPPAIKGQQLWVYLGEMVIQARG
jgi:hypothetical protein